MAERPRMTLNLVVREILAHAESDDQTLTEGHRKLLQAGATLVAAVHDGMSNPERVKRVREALEIIDC